MAAVRKTILILDDSVLVLEATTTALEHAGFDVTSAAELRGFERRLATTKPDLILLDVRMPEAFGDDVGAVLRQMRKLAVPIWLFSDLDEAELARRAKDAGLDGYISKRAGIPALIERVQAILGVRSV
jgi:DNA-binding response OmpR family regulator